MATVRLDIAYDGTHFHGWASQPGRRTVQTELETALETILREPVRLTVAGRTDAGVHALGQVASFETAATLPSGLLRSLNGVGPRDLSVTAASVMPDAFDARRDAVSRTYRYRILASPVASPFERGRALWWPHRADREALRGCAAALPGTHDFTAFTPTQTGHTRFRRRILAADWEEGEDGLLTFVVSADAFMRSMVRVLVGTMLEVGSGRRTQESFAALLEGAPRAESGDTAPAHGLYLASVAY